ncbi:hypothetical protein DSM104299_00317 [Baekduia alba]|uniref:hypothetical protein n=1 Tax=Baekduia alba TaxID=2997333 RepID=UPI002340FFD2|nr:hypothetical protein [Baekduia alba]WCB91644.1 hypothetical protein DSM104299_00317 [Baekduia alba]
MDLDVYRARAQAFATDLNRAHHRRFAGHDGAWDPDSLYAHHALAYDDATIEALRAAAGASDAGRRLLRFAVEARLGQATARTDAERARAEAQEGLADLTGQLAAEPDLSRRVALEEQRLDVVTRRLTPLAAEGLERVRAETRALGWASPRSLLATIHGRDPGALAAEAEALLRATAPPMLDGGGDAGGPATARFDLPRVHRAAWADPLLPTDPVGHLHERLGALGIDLAATGVTVDAAPRAGKSPRAFCAAISVPDDVHLVVAPRGGLADLEALFHEAGHALHLAHRDPGAPFEDRHLTDRAEAEALAFALEARATDGIDDQRLQEHRAALARLRTRHLAASLLHDLDLLDAGPHPALRERYARRLAQATGLTWPSAPWLVVADPLLTSADYLRALARARALQADAPALVRSLITQTPAD